MMLSEAANKLSASLVGDDILFKGCSIDSRQDQKNNLFIALKGERFDGHDFVTDIGNKGANAIMVNREVDSKLSQIIVKDTKDAMGRLASHWLQQHRKPVIGVTGSNGKTTVKEMLTEILSQNTSVLSTQGNYNNDIGMPLTLFGLNDQHDYIVLEMGANHPGEIRYLASLTKPDVAVITQCAPAHLEGFGSIDGVAKAKAEIYQGLHEDGVAIINNDDDYADYWLNLTADQQQILFGIEKPSDVFASEIKPLISKPGYEFVLNLGNDAYPIELAVAGKHNIMNALAAASCTWALNISPEQIKFGLENFSGVKGRMQIKTTLGGNVIVDDTYNANPTSLVAAIKYLVSSTENNCLVIGDMGELGDDSESFHYTAGKQAKALGVQTLFTHGELARSAAEAFGSGSKHFLTKTELISELSELDKNPINILVKGSRTMQMESVVEKLTSKENS